MISQESVNYFYRY